MSGYPWGLRMGLSGAVGALLGFAGLLLSGWGIMGYVIEELLKLVGVGVVRKVIGRVSGGEGLMVGLFFGITETIFYLLPMMERGVGEVGLRMLVTVPMHVATGGMIASHRWGIVGALVLHGLFNYWMR